jgi:hypothetical protein
MGRRHGRRQLGRRIVQLQGRAEVHRRALRWLHRDATLASRWIENGSNIPRRVLVYLHPTLGSQRLI